MQKLVLCIILIVLFNNMAVGQVDTIFHEKIVKSNWDSLEFIPQDQSFLPNDEILKLFETAFKKLDFKELEKYTTKLIWNHIDSLNMQLSELACFFHKSNSIEHRQSTKQGLSHNKGISAYSTFISDIDSLGWITIDYYYNSIDGINVINTIEIISNNRRIRTFPLLHDKIINEIELLNSYIFNNKYGDIIESYLKLIELCKETIVHKTNYYDYAQGTLSRYYGNIGWYYLVLGNGQEAINASRKGLEYFSHNTWI